MAGRFLPSRDGWPFSNASMAGLPLRVGPVPVGRVIGGLCGGMCVSALQHWRSGGPLPSDRRTALAEIVAAQVRSFDVPRAPYRYLRLQQPAAVDQRAATTRESLAQLRASLSVDRPVLLGLVCALGRSPLIVTEHHVVLAYSADDTRVQIYDPNYPRRDDVLLEIAGDGRQVTHSRGRAVYAVFVIDL